MADSNTANAVFNFYTLPEALYQALYTQAQVTPPVDLLAAMGDEALTMLKIDTASTNSSLADNATDRYAPVGLVTEAGKHTNTSGQTGNYLETLKYNTAIKVDLKKGVLMGAAWNDFAEYRKASETIEPGYVAIENGDDSVRKCNTVVDKCAPVGIVTDTYGMVIGEHENGSVPIAVAGRVLAYIDDREAAKENIGAPVGAMSNGTVGILDSEYAATYPWKIIGTISSVPEYEYWGEGQVPVNGRIWIKVK